jgi:ubiquinone/menaquinone biosynthesis C-methylase UbiE
MTTNNLRLIKSINLIKRNNKKILNSLEIRKLNEMSFQNKAITASEKNLGTDTFEKCYGNRKFYNTNYLSTHYVNSWIKKNCKDKICLDLACGGGSNSFKMQKANSKITIGLDISDLSIKKCEKKAKLHKISNIYFIQSDAENTRLPNNSIDIILCSGMLHHINLNKGFPEMKRILRPGGKILAIEALDYNPLIKLYRKLTPNMRTEWEKSHILSMSDVTLAKKYFLLDRINFWHVFSYLGFISMKLLPFLNLVDKILTKIPYIQLMAWIFTFELRKKN